MVGHCGDHGIVESNQKGNLTDKTIFQQNTAAKQQRHLMTHGVTASAVLKQNTVETHGLRLALQQCAALPKPPPPHPTLNKQLDFERCTSTILGNTSNVPHWEGGGLVWAYFGKEKFGEGKFWYKNLKYHGKMWYKFSK